MLTTDPGLFRGSEAEAWERLVGEVRLRRYGCDCYAYAMVAAGHADLVVESGLHVYDIAALIPIVEGAGGVVTALGRDFRGAGRARGRGGEPDHPCGSIDRARRSF